MNDPSLAELQNSSTVVTACIDSLTQFRGLDTKALVVGDLTVGAVQPTGCRPRGLDAGKGDRGGGGADARARTSDRPSGCRSATPWAML